MLKFLAAIVCVLIIAGALGVCSAGAQVTLPDVSAAVFDNSLQIDNSYFPLVPGTTYTYRSESTDPDTGEMETELILLEVLNQTRNVAGVETRVVRDSVFLEGIVIGDTLDWYAQDNAGNVWYMGEDVTDFEYDDQGRVIGSSHPGAWEAGVDGAVPGYIMEANPQVGDIYYQEFYAGVAEDEGEILGLGEMHAVSFGSFKNVIHTKYFSALDPDFFWEKFHAPGIGTIMERDFVTDTG